MKVTELANPPDTQPELQVHTGRADQIQSCLQNESCHYDSVGTKSLGEHFAIVKKEEHASEHKAEKVEAALEHDPEQPNATEVSLLVNRLRKGAMTKVSTKVASKPPIYNMYISLLCLSSRRITARYM